MRRTLFGGLRPLEPDGPGPGPVPGWPDRVVLALPSRGTGQPSLNDRYERKGLMYIGLGTLILIIILLILIF
jgi:hypothetical protein